MEESILRFMIEQFEEIQDPRVNRRKLHKLSDILTILLCGTLCGLTDLNDIVLFGKERIEWFRNFLELSNGIASSDTFRRVLQVIDPEELNKALMAIAQALRTSLIEKINHIAIDGKALRGSFDSALNKLAIHSVSAYCTSTGLSLGQVRTNEKSNEITAIPALIEMLKLGGAIVSIDSMGCQREIASLVRRRGGHYLLQVKLNQPTLYSAINDFTEKYREENFSSFSAEFHETCDKGHGRLEVRRHWSLPIDALGPYGFQGKWKDLTSFGIVEREVERYGKKTLEKAFYISSEGADARRLAEVSRGHWGIESHHWMLDVHLLEDKSRIRKDYSAENMAVLRRIALNLIRAATPPKKTMKSTRLRAALNVQALENVLTFPISAVSAQN